MVYDWEGKEETTRELYIHQAKSLEEVMEWFRINQDFAPSKRAFQTQIKKWNFPSKHTPLQTDGALVNRIRQLWAQNISQRNMLAILHDEGFQSITERELTRIRDKEGLKLRVASVKATPKKESSSIPAKRTHDEQTGEVVSQEQAVQIGDTMDNPHGGANQELATGVAISQDSPDTELTEEVIQKRQARFEKLQAESFERLQKRTRRRRTKSYAGLPPDPPAPPRFPSETTLEESKVILQLDKSMYANLRAKFEDICQQHSVIKKTEAGHDKWQAVKHQLIDEFPPIQPLFTVEDQAQLNHYFLALEMICNDVTKKLRTMKSRVTVADAKNVLGLDPEQGRQIKAAFHQILKADHFTSKLETGPEHWQGLKQKWIDGLPLLQAILAPGNADPDHTRKLKAMEHLCRDVMKRLRDSQTKEEKLRKAGGLSDQDPSLQPANANAKPPVLRSTPKPDPGKASTASQDANGANHSTNHNFDGISTLASQALASAPLPMSPPPLNRQPPHQLSYDYNNQIDPSLLSAAANLPDYQAQQPHFPPSPVYFRLAPTSQFRSPPAVWVGTLTAPTVSALRQLAVADRLYSNLSVSRIEGLIKTGNNETKLTISDDDELMAYMHHVKGETPTFVVNISYAS
ncbi:MAG: hypothetical protein LQ343_004586 [Gyalolechia ehrenbergii]|nr:MAG: hypothetical protein LQ343_004586 [Gyalolechia ehrenbergii]